MWEKVAGSAAGAHEVPYASGKERNTARERLREWEFVFGWVEVRSYIETRIVVVCSVLIGIRAANEGFDLKVAIESLKRRGLEGLPGDVKASGRYELEAQS